MFSGTIGRPRASASPAAAAVKLVDQRLAEPFPGLPGEARGHCQQMAERNLRQLLRMQMRDMLSQHLDYGDVGFRHFASPGGYSGQQGGHALRGGAEVVQPGGVSFSVIPLPN